MNKSVVIRGLKEADNVMLDTLRSRFYLKTNAKTLVRAGHECIRLDEEVERLAGIVQEYHKLKEDCRDLVKGVDALELIRGKVTE